MIAWQFKRMEDNECLAIQNVRGNECLVIQNVWVMNAW